jgi:hypothetical protein
VIYYPALQPAILDFWGCPEIWQPWKYGIMGFSHGEKMIKLLDPRPNDGTFLLRWKIGAESLWFGTQIQRSWTSLGECWIWVMEFPWVLRHPKSSIIPIVPGLLY